MSTPYSLFVGPTGHNYYNEVVLLEAYYTGGLITEVVLLRGTC